MPAVTCSTTSPQCCWVVRIWQLMGKTTSVSSTSSTACCYYLGSTTQTSGIKEVYCTSTGTVIQLNWANLRLSGSIPDSIGKLVNLQKLGLGGNQLNGSIPSSIGNLRNLTRLRFNSNKLSGSIPASIGNLRNLTNLYLNYNQGLNGTLTPPCSTQVYINTSNINRNVMHTNVTICGCASQFSPPAIFPPPGTPDACLATGRATSLQKRTQVFPGVIIGSYKYTCNLDPNNNPYQDCLNTMAKICNPDYMGTNRTLISDCKIGVNQMVDSMNIWWQRVRKACGQWKWTDGTNGNVNSTECKNANAALQSGAFYDGLPVSSSFIYSVNLRLWSNSNLKE